MKIIGLTSTTGPGSGKSTVGDILEVLYVAAGYPVKRLAFADIIKAQHTALFGECEKEWDYENGYEGRENLIKLGESARELCPDIWVHALESRMQKGYISTTVFIIDDIRKDIEVDMVFRHGGFVFDIQTEIACRPDSEQFTTPLSGVIVNRKQQMQTLIYDVHLDIFNTVEGL